jgi:SET domain-containing protein
MINEYYRPLPANLTIKESGIEGLGLFATTNIPKDELLGLTHVYLESFPDNYIRTPLGGFINYSEDPNCKVVKEEIVTGHLTLQLYTRIEIKKGEELTLKYHLYDPTK